MERQAQLQPEIPNTYKAMRAETNPLFSAVKNWNPKFQIQKIGMKRINHKAYCVICISPWS